MKTWEECQRDFIANRLAYCQGSGRWEAGEHNGRKYNYVRELDGQDVLCRFMARMAGPEPTFTAYEVVAAVAGPRRDVSRAPTWCNQAVGLFTFGMAGQDLDAFEGRERNANQLIAHMRAGGYNKGPVVWEQVPRESALAYAENGGLVMVACDVPGGIGHVAILQPNGLTTQAGAKTGIDIPIEVGFGKALAARVEFWACQVNDLGAEEND